MKKRRKSKGIKRVLIIFLTIILLIGGAYLFFEYNGSFNTNNKKEETAVEASSADSLLVESFLENIDDLGVLDNSDEINLPFLITAESVYLYDINNNKIIYSKNPEKKLAPASLTKIMTAILVLENEDDWENTMMTYKNYMGKEILEYGYTLEEIAAYEYEEGEQMSVKDSLYILMLRSANDTANLLGEYYGGSLDNFINMMNKKAKKIGAFNTNFSNTHGLDDENLYTTAYDMFLITQYAMGLPGFSETTSTLTYTLGANNFHEEREIENVLGIMNPKYPEFFYPYLEIGKSGYTNAAGRCLISTAKKGEEEFLIVLMNVPLKDEYGDKLPSSLFFSETKDLYDWAFLNY